MAFYCRKTRLFYNTSCFYCCKKSIFMKSDEKRSHRLNYLLKCYLTYPHQSELYKRAKQMGVSDSTAKDYMRTVIIQAQKIHAK